MVLHHLQIYDAEPILTYWHLTDTITISTGRQSLHCSIASFTASMNIGVPKLSA